MTRYFINKQYLVEQLKAYQQRTEHLSQSEIIIHIFDLIFNNLTDTSKECLDTCHTIFVKFAEFIRMFRAEISDLKKKMNLSAVNMFIYDQSQYYQSKGQLIGQQLFGRHQEYSGAVHDNELDSLATIDLQYRIPKDEVQK